MRAIACNRPPCRRRTPRRQLGPDVAPRTSRAAGRGRLPVGMATLGVLWVAAILLRHSISGALMASGNLRGPAVASGLAFSSGPAFPDGTRRPRRRRPWRLVGSGWRPLQPAAAWPVAPPTAPSRPAACAASRLPGRLPACCGPPTGHYSPLTTDRLLMTAYCWSPTLGRMPPIGRLLVVGPLLAACSWPPATGRPGHLTQQGPAVRQDVRARQPAHQEAAARPSNPRPRSALSR